MLKIFCCCFTGDIDLAGMKCTMWPCPVGSLWYVLLTNKVFIFLL